MCGEGFFDSFYEWHQRWLNEIAERSTLNIVFTICLTFFLSLQSSTTTTMIEKSFHAIFVCHLLIFNMWLPRQLRRATEVMALVEHREKKVHTSWVDVVASFMMMCLLEQVERMPAWKMFFLTHHETQQIRSYNVLLCHLKNASCKCKPNSHRNVSHCTVLIVCRKYTTSTSGKIFGIQTFIAYKRRRLIRSIWSHVKMLDDRAARHDEYTQCRVCLSLRIRSTFRSRKYTKQKKVKKNRRWKMKSEKLNCDKEWTEATDLVSRRK